MTLFFILTSLFEGWLSIVEQILPPKVFTFSYLQSDPEIGVRFRFITDLIIRSNNIAVHFKVPRPFGAILFGGNTI